MFCYTISLFLLVLLFADIKGIQRSGSKREGLYSVSEGTVLTGHVIQRRYVTSPLECGYFCTTHPQCLSYNYKRKGSGNKNVCELNEASRKSYPESYFFDPYFDHYYDVESERSRSCLDYLRNGATENGLYTITDVSGDSYQVWCDLNSEPRSAWTLVLSFAREYRYSPQFCKRSFAESSPINNESPNWTLYRMYLIRMRRLTGQSSHWRATTSFAVYGVDYTDYLRGNFSSFDIFNYEDINCKDVEYINIRGTKAWYTQASFWQKKNLNFLHVFSCSPQCAFKAVNCTSTESSFGSYCEASNSANPKFRGTMDDSSTTEWWFGGYL